MLFKRHSLKKLDERVAKSAFVKATKERRIRPRAADGAVGRYLVLRI